MAKIVLTFQDGDDEQLISYFSDRDVDITSIDMNALTPAEQLAAIALDLLDEYVTKEGASVERPLSKEVTDKMN
jgi:hypothetical protein